MIPLEERIKYKFRNALLLAEALTHPSLGYETQRHHFDNQRLEFLGDAVLQLIFTEHLFKLFPDCSEGDLTKMRSRLVSKDGLHVHGLNLGLGDYMMMGKGEESTGGRLRPSALADAFEALVGAMFLDSDFETVKQFVIEEAQRELDNLSADSIAVNPKGMLQETLQAISPLSPVYELVSESGPEHQKRFVTEVWWSGMKLGAGEGMSKRDSEKAAAMNALETQLWLEKPVS
jgi:ribonuclease-3